jgi:hypothetical protein
MIAAMTYIGIGALFIAFAHDIATMANRLSVRPYERFPILKRLPRSELAGSQRNYKSTFYFLRIVGVFMLVGGILMLGAEMRHWK